MKQFVRLLTNRAGSISPLLLILLCFPVFILFVTAGCYRRATPIEVTLQRRCDTLNIICANSVNVHSQWPLPYPVYRFVQGDITGDGVNEILVGVIKPTRFDTINRKRLFIFKLVEGNIRPLWMGSRVAQPLVDFKVAKTVSGSVIRTIEEERDGTYLVAEYKWRRFGLEFIHYINRRISKNKALQLLDSPA
jgi:hypothetical protein